MPTDRRSRRQRPRRVSNLEPCSAAGTARPAGSEAGPPRECCHQPTRIAAGEPMLVPKAIEDPLGGVALLARAVRILQQPLVDDLCEPVQLRPLDRRRPPIPRRCRIHDHLVDAVARDPEVTRDPTLGHALPEIGPAHLPIQLHGENASALPAARKGKRGRLLRRPPRDHHAATVADFCTAVLTAAFRQVV